MKTIREILFDLVAIQSDTGTELEKNIANKIYEIILNDDYFKANSEFCGEYLENDLLGRPVVWGLKRGNTDKTIILMGHYDAVQIETYGPFKEFALDPTKLRKALSDSDFVDEEINKDIKDMDWEFGRGISDMKAGVAINLHTLLNHDKSNVNILFIAVPDEENISSGAIQSVGLYHKLKKKYNLEYTLSIITEPQIRTFEEPLIAYEGSMGKFMPAVVTKGVLTHSAFIFNGMNSGLILSDMIQEIELNMDMVSEDKGVFTQPPTVQLFKDLKTTYDVSVPEYSGACFNFLFLNTKSPLELIQDIKRISIVSIERAIERYNNSFDLMNAKGFIKEKYRKKFDKKVITTSELEKYLIEEKKGYKEFKVELNKNLNNMIMENKISLQNATLDYMRQVLEYSAIEGPLVLIGVSPPYYPAVANHLINKDASRYFEGVDELINEKIGVNLEFKPYFAGMCDMSYMSINNIEHERIFMDNIVIEKDIYDIPVEKIADLNIPSYLLGPASKDIHQLGERVYMPDVETNIPSILNKIISNF